MLNNGKNLLFTKGAYFIILSFCGHDNNTAKQVAD